MCIIYTQLVGMKSNNTNQITDTLPIFIIICASNIESVSKDFCVPAKRNCLSLTNFGLTSTHYTTISYRSYFCLLIFQFLMLECYAIIIYAQFK